MKTGERLLGVRRKLRCLRWTLLLGPLLITGLTVAFGTIFVLFLFPFILWGLLSITDPRIVMVCVYVFLFFVLPRFATLVAANVILWGGALYVCRDGRRTESKTMFYSIAAPISLFRALRFLLWFAFQLWLAFRMGAG